VTFCFQALTINNLTYLLTYMLNGDGDELVLVAVHMENFQCQGPLQLLSPPFLMTNTTKQMRSNGKGGLLAIGWRWCSSEISVPHHLVFTLNVNSGAADACRDRLGRFVPVGEYFVPDDPCRTCLCDGGEAVACAIVQCSQPECDHFQRIEGECCSVQCIQMSSNSSADKSASNGFSGMFCVCVRGIH